MLIPSVKDLDVQRKRVLVRVDFNVPFDEKGHISDLTRIRASLPTLEFLLKKNASLILLSHRGRPQGKDDSCSLKPCAQALEKLLQRPVLFAPDCLQADKLIERLTPGSVLLLENLRFYPAEEHPNLDPLFAKTLASYGDLYVNDAFAAAHRAHSSIVPIVSYFPKKAAAGFLLEKEMHALAPLLTCPQKPFHLRGVCEKAFVGK